MEKRLHQVKFLCERLLLAEESSNIHDILSRIHDHVPCTSHDFCNLRLRTADTAEFLASCHLPSGTTGDRFCCRTRLQVSRLKIEKLGLQAEDEHVCVR